MTGATLPGPRLLDLTLPSPEENLALDEALLLEAEAQLARGEAPAGCEVLRFWESPAAFVVLGVACRLAEDVDERTARRHRSGDGKRRDGRRHRLTLGSRTA